MTEVKEKAKPGSKQSQTDKEMSVVKQITRLMDGLTPGGRERVWRWLGEKRAEDLGQVPLTAAERTIPMNFAALDQRS